MQKKIQQYTPIAILSLVLLIGSAFLFSAQIGRRDPDIYLHSLLSLQQWDREVYSHVLYFLLLKIFSGFSTDLNDVNRTAIILLSIATVFKYLVINYILKKNISHTFYGNRSWIIALISFSLCIIHAIPLGKANFMPGLFTATNWHNSTIIMQTPLALLQFYLSYQLLIRFSGKSIVLLSITIILSNLLKPNFFLCFAPIYTLLIAFECRFRFNTRFLLSVLPVMIGIIILAIEYWLIYSSGGEGGIGIHFFLVWDHFITMKWLALLFSFAFPGVYLLLNFSYVKTDKMLVFAWLIVLLGLLIFIAFYEKGERMFHANFIWQMVPAMLIPFLTTIINWVKRMDKEGSSLFQLKNIICMMVFLIHVLAGCVYIYKVIHYGIS